jgi:hypothetical protein
MNAEEINKAIDIQWNKKTVKIDWLGETIAAWTSRGYELWADRG